MPGYWVLCQCIFKPNPYNIQSPLRNPGVCLTVYLPKVLHRCMQVCMTHVYININPTGVLTHKSELLQSFLQIFNRPAKLNLTFKDISGGHNAIVDSELESAGFSAEWSASWAQPPLIKMNQKSKKLRRIKAPVERAERSVSVTEGWMKVL